MTATETLDIESELLATLLSDDVFWPSEPRSLSETGLSTAFIESLILKYLAEAGTASGRQTATSTCLPFGLLEDVFASLRTRQLIVHANSAAFNDYYYTLTEQGQQKARLEANACSYVGPAPVPMMDYVISVEAQTIGAESPRRERLEQAFEGISVDDELFDILGPAINSGAGMFLYGSPGNGKSTIAKRITVCFGQEIWVPHAIIDGGQIIKFYDSSYHEELKSTNRSLIKTNEFDRRWIKVRRPTVVVGGELTMDSLEIRHDPRSNVSEAPLQLKSNCGCLVIDDFGRQRIAPTELLNRWIVPLECRHDFLTLPNGKKIQVPFEQLIIFSTNLEPSDLVDEAFLRRIPYKIEIANPDEAEFHGLFQIFSDEFNCEYRREAVEYLLARHYRPTGRALRRCHPRDLMRQIRNYCAYHDQTVEMRPEYFDRVVAGYFTTALDKPAAGTNAAPFAPNTAAAATQATTPKSQGPPNTNKTTRTKTEGTTPLDAGGQNFSSSPVGGPGGEVSRTRPVADTSREFSGDRPVHDPSGEVSRTRPVEDTVRQTKPVNEVAKSAASVLPSASGGAAGPEPQRG